MDKIILGILMLKRFTVYEIRSMIQKNFQSMCSDSLGSIQAAIKKLLSAGMITYTEYVEKSVNKKQYAITDLGRKNFLDWLQTPAMVSNPKNMEFGKILFMGLVPAQKRLPLLDEIIALLEKELNDLLQLQLSLQESNEKEHMIAFLESDSEYLKGIQNATQNLDITENADEIGFFEAMTLQYGIDSTRFQIDWFRKLRAHAANGNTTYSAFTKGGMNFDKNQSSYKDL